MHGSETCPAQEKLSKKTNKKAKKEVINITAEIMGVGTTRKQNRSLVN